MKPTNLALSYIIILAATACAFLVQAADPPVKEPALDQAFAHLKTYDWAESRAPLAAIDEAINASFSDPARRRLLETRLAAALDTASSLAAKRFVCERLSVVGSGVSVPALASLLSNPATSHPARLALERIPDPRAAEALRRFLPEVENKLKIGIINSLGVLRDANAVALLTNLLANSNSEVVRAAASALGRIATSEAARALGEFRNTAPKDLAAVVTGAWLVAGEGLLERGDRAAAAAIFRQLYTPDQAAPLRLAAFRGLIAADPDRAAPSLSQALAGDDELLQTLAAHLIADGRQVPVLTSFISSLRSYAPGGQVAVLDAIRERRETSARPVVLGILESQHPTVRLAALRTLAVVGAAPDVPLLARLSGEGTAEEKTAALLALANLPGKDINAAIRTQLGAATSAGKIELLHTLVSRKAVEAGPSIAQHLADPSPSLQIAALDAMATLGGAQQVKPVINLLTATTDDKVAQAAEQALRAIAGRVGPDCTEPLLAGLKDSRPDTQIVLLRVLGVAGGAKALQSVRAALQGTDIPLRDAAFRVLTEWPGLEAASDLLRLAQAQDNPYRALLAFRGYVRLCREGRNPVPEKVRMLGEVTATAKTAAQKRLLIAALGDLPDPAVLKQLAPFFTDADLAEETCLAAVKVAAGLDPASSAAAVPALQQVIKLSNNQDLREQARKTVERLNAKPESVPR